MRIIAGKFKGKKLNTFEAENIRPTSDMVKGAICSKLQFDITGANVLDLFGGTGNFGFECLSRGANSVVICDNNPKSIEIINKNNLMFNNLAQVVKGDFSDCLKKFKTKFDIVFLDPPYNTDFGQQALDLIKTLDILNKNAIIVFEHNFNKDLSFNGYTLLDQKKYGIKQVSYLEVDYDKGN